MKFLSIKLLVIAIAMTVATSAFAYRSYDVTVNTSSLNGIDGYLYFQYLGVNAVNSTATVSGFAGGTLAATRSAEVVDGSAVTGQLPGTVVFANTNGVNDYNHAITFGSSLDFNLLFSPPAPGAPVGGSSTFSLALFADEFGGTPLLTTDGTLFAIDLMNDGASAVASQSSQAEVSPVPVPAALWLLGSGLAGMAGLRRRQRLA